MIRSYIHKYHSVRFAQVVKALVCAMCLWSIVQTACADEFKVNERITSKLQHKKITAYSWKNTCEIPVTDIIGSGGGILEPIAALCCLMPGPNNLYTNCRKLN